MRWTKLEDIIAWKESMHLVDLVYEFSAKFPSEERFGLTAQIRRAAVSVPSNIAEGFGRKGSKTFLLFLSYSLGSLAELETQMKIAYNQMFAIENSRLETQIRTCRKLIFGLITGMSGKTNAI